MDLLLQKLEDKIKEYAPNADFEIVTRAYLLAKEAHNNQIRYSGEPYISHPLEVAFILAELHMDTDAICAGILHDVIEDTEADYETIKINFNDNIAHLVNGVTKIGKIQLESKEQRQAESLRKMIIAMSTDIRVIIIKLADRLHNMRTLSAMRPDKQRQKARETLDIYAPIAHRLGISKIKWELEDLSLLYLDPDAYHEISRKVALKREERENFIKDVKEKLSKVLTESFIEAKIEGRPKHFFSIYKKMKKGKAFEEIYDLFAVRVLVENVKDCYGVLGIVHTLWNPLPGRFKDYIAMPKPNMYQSLHTTVFTKGAAPFEIQIRTYEMHRTAEYGIAAHWKYKEGIVNKKEDDFEKKLIWIRELMEMENELKNSDEFMEGIKFDLFTDEVFVFTPNSKVVQLPNGACPIDFAYRIHSDIGNQCVGAKVNGKMVPLTYVLKNGDIVSIITSPNSKGPSRDWLNIVKSSHARTKIKSFFKKADREENIVRGKDLLEKEFKKDGVPLSKVINNEHLDFAVKRFNIKTWDDLYSAIGYGGLKATFVSQKIKDHFKNEFIASEKKEEVKVAKTSNANKDNVINIQGHTDFEVFFANCCNPVPGDNIVGYITKNRGVSIHRADCINVSSTINQNRLINVSWNEKALNTNKTFQANIKIKAVDRKGLVADISTLISNEGINMSSFSSGIENFEGSFVNMCVNISDTNELITLIKKLNAISGVKKVIRI